MSRRNSPGANAAQLIEKLVETMERRLAALKRRLNGKGRVGGDAGLSYACVRACDDASRDMTRERRAILEGLRRHPAGALAYVSPELLVLARVETPSGEADASGNGCAAVRGCDPAAVLEQLAEASPLILFDHGADRCMDMLGGRCQDVLTAMPCGVFVYRFEAPDRLYLEDCNPAACWLTGIAIEQFRGLEFDEIWPNAATFGTKNALLAVLSTGEPYEAEDVCHKDRRLEVSLLVRAFGLPGQRLAVLLDNITGRKVTENQFRHMALHDALTGLANRVKLRDRVMHALQVSRRWPETLFALLFLDLDRFKLVNDTFGHALGDALLIEVGRRLTVCVRAHDTVCRYGGDEYVILLEEMSAANDAMATARRIRQALAEPFVLDRHTLSVSASVGIALSPFSAESPEEPIRRANMAMHHAKEAGGGVRVFSKKMLQKSVAAENLESDLDKALDHGEFRLLYQPIVDSGEKEPDRHGSRVQGFEVLLRWSHPQKGLIHPMDFIPQAEESGKIPRIGSWVMDKACETLAGWQREGTTGEGMFLSINVSPRELAWVDFMDSLGMSLAAHGLQAEALRLEIGETAVMKSNAALFERMRQLSDQGVGLSLDDFGTGYSNIALLGRLRLSGVKIDTSIIRTLEHYPQNGALIRAITTMAACLGLNVIAEGVETPGQRRILMENGCRLQQGYLYSKPLLPGEVSEFLAGYR